jgi:hypothetical protein
MKLTYTLFTLTALAAVAQPRLLLNGLAKPGARIQQQTTAAKPMIITQTSDTAIPFITNGDGLRTRITLLNLENTAATYQIVFVSSEGTTYNVPWTDRDPSGNIRGTIQPNSMVELLTTGEGEITTGWSLASATGARVVFTAHNETATGDGHWNTATFYPGNSNSKRQKIRFDNRDGYETTLVLNNINTTATPVTIAVRDAAGRLIGVLDGVSMDVLNQYAIRMSEDFPASAGILGTVEISIPTSSRSGASVLGVRLNASNGAIDLIDSFSTVAWSQ